MSGPPEFRGQKLGSVWGLGAIGSWFRILGLRFRD